MLDTYKVKNPNCLCIVSVRYEGHDAASHEIDLNLLGQSLQGFAQVFALCADALVTGRLSGHRDALEVRVVSLPVAEHHCFEVLAMIESFAASKELWSGAFGAVLAVVVQYVLTRRDQDQMKYLNEALQQSMQNLQRSMQNNQDNYITLTRTVDKMMAVLDKLADSLRPAARRALAPVDRSCERIDLYADGEQFASLDATHRRAFDHAGLSRHLCEYVGVISGFDMETGNCKVTLEGGVSRIPAVVIDPVFNRPNNPYAEAMAAAYPLRFLAKADLDAQGNPATLYISDTSERASDWN
jgi:hypothetical protein